MTILLSDPRVSAVPLRECDEPLVALAPSFGPARARVRAGLAGRLESAAARLPDGVRFRVVEGHRSLATQRAIIAVYSAEVCRARPGVSPSELHHLVSRFVAPVEVAPHVAGAAVDLTLVDACGDDLDLGTPIDATPEQSAGACATAAANVPPRARALRRLMGEALGEAGLVNYPTEWWHWSYGDRYWALLSGSPHALYGPVDHAVEGLAAQRLARGAA
jgi:D-alanyl-D-alanine dipeptidase